MKCPESIEQLEELEEKWIPLCRKGLYEQAQARKEADPDKSERKIAKELAEEAGVPEETENIRAKIKYEKKEKSGRNLPPSQRNASEKKKKVVTVSPSPQSSTSEKKKQESEQGDSTEPPPQCPIPDKSYVITDAMAFATTAISHLERIDRNDPEREKALNHVEEWIINNI